ncbi:hypothetical protein ABK040_014663 [Willaertia magna]
MFRDDISDISGMSMIEESTNHEEEEENLFLIEKDLKTLQQNIHKIKFIKNNNNSTLKLWFTSPSISLLRLLKEKNKKYFIDLYNIPKEEIEKYLNEDNNDIYRIIHIESFFNEENVINQSTFQSLFQNGEFISFLNLEEKKLLKWLSENFQNINLISLVKKTNILNERFLLKDKLLLNKEELRELAIYYLNKISFFEEEPNTLIINFLLESFLRGNDEAFHDLCKLAELTSDNDNNNDEEDCISLRKLLARHVLGCILGGLIRINSLTSLPIKKYAKSLFKSIMNIISERDILSQSFNNYFLLEGIKQSKLMIEKTLQNNTNFCCLNNYRLNFTDDTKFNILVEHGHLEACYEKSQQQPSQSYTMNIIINDLLTAAKQGNSSACNKLHLMFQTKEAKTEEEKEEYKRKSLFFQFLFEKFDKLFKIHQTKRFIFDNQYPTTTRLEDINENLLNCPLNPLLLCACIDSSELCYDSELKRFMTVDNIKLIKFLFLFKPLLTKLEEELKILINCLNQCDKNYIKLKANQWLENSLLWKEFCSKKKLEDLLIWLNINEFIKSNLILPSPLNSILSNIEEIQNKTLIGQLINTKLILKDKDNNLVLYTDLDIKCFVTNKKNEKIKDCEMNDNYEIQFKCPLNENEIYLNVLIDNKHIYGSPFLIELYHLELIKPIQECLISNNNYSINFLKKKGKEIIKTELFPFTISSFVKDYETNQIIIENCNVTTNMENNVNIKINFNIQKEGNYYLNVFINNDLKLEFPLKSIKEIVWEKMFKEGKIDISHESFPTLRDLMIKAINIDAKNLMYAPDELKDDKELLWLAFYNLEYIFEPLDKYNTIEQIILEAEENDINFIKLISEKMKRFCSHRVLENNPNYSYLQYASNDLKNDTQFILNLFQLHNILHYFDVNFNSVKEIYLYITKMGRIESSINYLSTELKDDKELFLEIVKFKGSLLQQASERLRSDKEIIYHSFYNLSYISKPLDYYNEAKDVVLDAVKINGYCLSYISKELKNNEEICKAAIEINYNNFSHTEYFHNKKDWYLKILPFFPRLYFASISLRKDKELVNKAIEYDPNNLKYVHPDLKKEKDIIYKALFTAKYISEPIEYFKNFNDPIIEMAKDALLNHQNSFQLIPFGLRSDTDVALLLSPSYYSNEMKDNKELMLKIVKKNGDHLQYASNRLKNDLDVLYEAFNQLKVISKEKSCFKSAKDFILYLLKNNNSIYKLYLPKQLSKDEDVIRALNPHKNKEIMNVKDRFGAEDKNLLKQCLMTTPSLPRYRIHSTLLFDKEILWYRFFYLGLIDKEINQYKTIKELILEVIQIEKPERFINYLPNYNDLQYLFLSDVGYFETFTGITNLRQLVLYVLQNCGILYGLNLKEFSDDKEILLSNIQNDFNNSSVLSHASNRLKHDKEFIWNYFYYKGYTLKSLEEYENAEQIVLENIEYDFNIFPHLSIEMRNSRAIVKKSIKRFVGSNVLQYSSAEIRDDKEIALLALMHDPKSFQYLSDKLQSDEELFSLAIKYDPHFNCFKGYPFSNEFLKKIIKYNHRFFSYCSIYLRSDKEFIINTMKQFPDLWYSAAPALKHDKEFLQYAFQYGTYYDNDNKEMMLSRCHVYASERLKRDKDFIWTVFKKIGLISKEKAEYNSIKEMALEAAEKPSFSLNYLSKEMQEDKDIIRKIFTHHPNNLIDKHDLCDKFDRDIALYVVKRKGDLLKYLREQFKSDFEIVLEAVKQNGNALQYASNNLRESETIVMEAIKVNPESFNYYAIGAARRNKNIISYFVEKSPDYLKYMAHEAFKDEEILLKVLKYPHDIKDYLNKNKDIVVKYISSFPSIYYALEGDLKLDREIIIKALKADGNVFKDVPNHLKNDIELCWTAFTQLKIISLPLQKYKNINELALEIVTKDGKLLSYLSNQCKNDKNIVMTAIEQNAESVGYCSYRLRNDYDVILTAVKRNGNLLSHASNFLKNVKSIAIDAVTENSKAIINVSNRLKDDIDIAKLATKKDIEMLQHVSLRLRNNKEFILNLIERDVNAFKYASEFLKNDKEIVYTCLKKLNLISLPIDAFGSAKEIILYILQRDTNINAYSTYMPYIGKILRQDRDIVKYLIPKGIIYLSNYPWMRVDEELILEIVSENNKDLNYLNYISPILKDKKCFMIKLVKINGNALSYASEDLKNDKEVVWTALNQLKYINDPIETFNSVQDIFSKANNQAFVFRPKEFY